MLNLVKRLFVEEEGQGLVEYALIISLIAIVVIAAVTGLGGKVVEIFTNITNSI